MAAKRTQEQISDIMRRVKSEDTSPEIKFRKALWARGVRYRLHDSRLPGKPDIVIPKARLAVFIDGDYWHGNQWRTRGHASLQAQFVASPKAEYWIGKIGRNMRRDMRNTATLLENGWRVLRFWESDVASDLEGCIAGTTRAMRKLQKESRRALLPERSVAVFPTRELAAVSLTDTGWTVGYYHAHSPFSRAAAPPPTTLWMAGIGDTELIGDAIHIMLYVPQILWKQRRTRPPFLLFIGGRGWLEFREGRPLADFIGDVSRVGYCCDLFKLDDTICLLFSSKDLPGISVDPLPSSPSLLRPRLVMEFIGGYSNLPWRLERLPELDFEDLDEVEPLEWVVERYIEPAITAWIHGVLLEPCA